MTDCLSGGKPEMTRGRKGLRIFAAGVSLVMLSGFFAGAGAQTQVAPKNLFELLTFGLRPPPVKVATTQGESEAGTVTHTAPVTKATSRIGARSGRPGRGLIFRSRNGKRIKKVAAAPRILTEVGTSPIPIQSQDTVDAIRASIVRYKAISAAGGWELIEKTKAPRKGERSRTVLALAVRLNMTGDLPSRPSKAPVFDAKLVDALKRFQVRHGLPPSGVLDEATRTELNIDVLTRISQLEINLNRVVKLIRGKKAKRFVMVNIPGYEIEAVEGGTVDFRQRVILGRPTRETPVLKTSIIQLNFSPYWHVPQSIVRKDLIPKLQDGTEYLTQSKLRVYKTWGGQEIDPATIDWSSPDALKLRFRQDTGPENAMGYLRLNMPNRDAVFLHDTPQKSLFTDDVRAFSSGCVRVQNIAVLAEWLAKYDDGWTADRIEETFQSGERKDLTLRKPVPVYFSYVTAWASPDGTVQFRRDLYNKDGLVQLAAVNAAQDVSLTP
ncbi:MAG: L,D-transpeptidase family protein [Alphaproteobacteria bacterium]